MAQKTKSKKFYRSRTDRIIAGVCGGLGEYFDTNSNIIRLIFILLVFFQWLGVFLYIILFILVPLKPGGEISVNREEKVEEIVKGIKKKASSLVNEFKKDKKDK
ncbi:PspC domain-containing protein [Patescibacteria group bacterium]|nr:PspC domain-containing protein [Patescibacteria group bacterium]